MSGSLKATRSERATGSGEHGLSAVMYGSAMVGFSLAPGCMRGCGATAAAPPHFRQSEHAPRSDFF